MYWISSFAAVCPIIVSYFSLPYWGRVTHIWVSNLDHHWYRKWLVAWPAPSHYLVQCWNIINLNLRNKLQWNINQNSYIFIQEITFENVIQAKCQPFCLGLNEIKIWKAQAKDTIQQQLTFPLSSEVVGNGDLETGSDELHKGCWVHLQQVQQL